MPEPAARPAGGWAASGEAALFTDLYELTMAASYFAEGMNGAATFDLFVRELPPERNFLVASGLETALAYIEGLRFTSEAIVYLRSLGMFASDFLDWLGDLRFTGEVWAVPEGEAVFAGEPLVRVTAPLIEAQVVETFLLNAITHQTMMASKAARVALACGTDRTFVHFSGRRDHGVDATLGAARASYLAGAAATANVLAGRLLGIPVTGTMAHSYVTAFPDEAAAFRAYARSFPERAVLLIDTYDTEQGARVAADVAVELSAEGIHVQGVRLDSGDLETLSFAVRQILDSRGAPGVAVVASGDLDERSIARLVTAGAPIASFGVGTQLGTSGDAPSLGGVYKLVDYEGPRMKRSAGKASLPGRKQVHRFTAEDGTYAYDIVALEGEDPGGRALLEPVLRDGRRLGPAEPLGAIRSRCAATLRCLPDELRRIDGVGHYDVRLSSGLDRLSREVGSRS